MNVLVFTGGLLAGTIVTVFLMGIFPVRETLRSLARGWLLTLTITAGVIALAGLVNGWLVITACSILTLCGTLVLMIARQSQGKDIEHMLKILRFNIEVAIKEGQYEIEDKVDDTIEELRDSLGESLEETEGKVGKALKAVEDRIGNINSIIREQGRKTAQEEAVQVIKEEVATDIELSEEEVANAKWRNGKLIIEKSKEK